MSPSIPEPAAWLCLAVAAVLGATVLCRLKKSPRQVGRQAAYGVGVWGAACLLLLPFCFGVLLFVLSCLLLLAYLYGQELLPVDGKAVLITGCDTGIGHSLAKYLDKRGFTVFAGVLEEQGPGAEELRRACSARLSVLQMDITNPAQIKDAHSEVVRKVQGRGLWAVINNAGVLGFPCDGELIPMTDYRQCMDVNFFGAVAVTKTFLPLLRKTKGRLVNISSMSAAGVPMQKLAAYSSSKAALAMFSSVLRLELSRWGVKVITIYPGGFKTNLTGTEEARIKLEKNLLEALSPEVQDDYTHDYIVGHRNIFHLLLMRSREDYSPLILDVQHAVLARSPFTLYAPGRESLLWLYAFSFLPTPVYDFLTSNTQMLLLRKCRHR